MISISEIRSEIEKIFDKDFLKSEYKKIKKEVKALDLYKKLPAPTLKHISQLEDQFSSLSKKLGKQQKRVDKEISNAINLLEKRKVEATSKFKDFRDYAFEQKEFIEDAIREKLEKLAGEENEGKAPKAVKRKAASKKASAKKASSKKTVRKAAKKVSKATKTSKKKVKAKTKAGAKKTKAKATSRKTTTTRKSRTRK